MDTLGTSMFLYGNNMEPFGTNVYANPTLNTKTKFWECNHNNRITKIHVLYVISAIQDVKHLSLFIV